MARTWILTGSPKNHAATRVHDFAVIGLKERNRNRALQVEPGDRIAKWPPEHWKLAFQGQIRPVSEHDASLLLDRMSAAAGAHA